MRVAAVGDIHLTRSRLEGPQGHAALWRQVVEDIVQSGSELCVVTGDIAGQTVPHRPSIDERNVFVEGVLRISQAMPVVIARGNHDPIGEWSFLSKLRAKTKDGKWSPHGIHYVETPKVLIFSSFSVAVMPWMDEAVFADQDVPWSRAITTAYKELESELDDDLPAFAVIHGAFSGAFIREGQPTVPTTDPVITADAILDPDRYTAAFVGHYHQFQKIPGRVPTYYCGSLFANTFGESGEKGWVQWSDDKGHRLVEVEQPLRVKVTFDVDDEKVLTVEPPVLRWVGKTAEEVMEFLQNKKQGKHQVKLAFEASEKQAKNFAPLVERMKDIVRRQGGRLEVQAVIQRVANTREGAHKIAKARSIGAKFAEWAKQLSPAPSKEAIERCRATIAQADSSEAA